MTSWQSAPHTLMLNSNDIHVWRAKLSVPAELLQQYATLLSPDETKRAQRFHFDILRNRFTAGRAILRLMLSHYLNYTPQEISFTYEDHGKPNLKDNPNQIEFNVSHSEDYLVAAFTLNHLIGIDIEKISDRSEAEIAQRFFSQEEYDTMMRLPEQDQQHAFFHIWTQKEAFIKAIGQGLSFPLKDFIVSVQTPAKLVSLKNGNSNDWHLQDFFSYPGFTTAFATQQKVNHVEYFNFI